MKKVFSILLCLFIVFMGFSALAQTTVYEDIQSHWAKEEIESLSSKGIVNGYDGKFRPDDFITRGEFAVVLNRIFLFDDPAENIFDDLKENYYTQAILCLNKQGIMNGFEKSIRPDDSITREEAATMLVKALKIETQEISTLDFADENEISDWAKPYMITLSQMGVISGYNNYLRPKDNITRAETVVMLSKGIPSENDTAEDKALASDETMPEEAPPTTSDNTEIEESTDADTEDSSYFEEDSEFFEVEEEIYENFFEEENEEESDEENVTEEEIPEELKPTIETTLEDGLLQRNSRKVFDVIARDIYGNKIESFVSFNGINIEPSWDDEVKTSFLLEFQESGEYTIEVSATDADGISQTCTYSISYEMAEYGEPIGKATVCVEAFTVGGGYIIAPMEIDVLEGINCAYLLDELFTNNNLPYMNTGSLDGGFYLATVSNLPEFTPAIPETLYEALIDAGFDVDEESYTPNELSEFDFTQGSGWMYSVNGSFPNVGFSEYYLQDGDVMRIQYTLAYGADIGGASGAGFAYADDFYEIVNRDELTKIIANIGIEIYSEDMELISKPDLTEDELEYLLSKVTEDILRENNYENF